MITIADVRARVETDLDDATIQRIIDAAVEEIEGRHGSAGLVTDYFQTLGSKTIVLSRRPASIIEVRERRVPTDEPLVVPADAYRQQSLMVLYRIDTVWGFEVQVDYMPFVNAQMRDRIALDLVQLDIEFRAFESERIGDWQGNQSDYADRRLAILKQLREPARGIV